MTLWHRWLGGKTAAQGRARLTKRRAFLERLEVRQVMTAPVAHGATPQTSEEAPLAITLNGSDADNDALSYIVTSSPAHGVLTGTAPDLIYTPTDDYVGPDCFDFQVNDGTEDSAPAVIEITVSGVNDAPVLTQNYTSAVNYTRDQVPGVYILRGAIDPNPP